VPLCARVPRSPTSVRPTLSNARCWPQDRLLILIRPAVCQWHLRRQLARTIGPRWRMKPKTKLLPPTEVLYGSVASGEVENRIQSNQRNIGSTNRRTRWPVAVSDSELHPVRPRRRFTGSSQTGRRKSAGHVSFPRPAAQAVLKAKASNKGRVACHKVHPRWRPFHKSRRPLPRARDESTIGWMEK